MLNILEPIQSYLKETPSTGNSIDTGENATSLTQTQEIFVEEKNDQNEPAFYTTDRSQNDDSASWAVYLHLLIESFKKGFVIPLFSQLWHSLTPGKNPVLEKIEWFLSREKIPRNEITSAFYLDYCTPNNNWNVKDNLDASDRHEPKQKFIKKIKNKEKAAIFFPKEDLNSINAICQELEGLCEQGTSSDNQHAMLRLLFGGKKNVLFQMLKGMIVQHCIPERQDLLISHTSLFNSIDTRLRKQQPLMIFDDVVTLCREATKPVEARKIFNKTTQKENGTSTKKTPSSTHNKLSKKSQKADPLSAQAADTYQTTGMSTFTAFEQKNMPHYFDDESLTDDESVISTNELENQAEKETKYLDSTPPVQHSNSSSTQPFKAQASSFLPKILTLGLIDSILIGGFVVSSLLGLLSSASLAIVAGGIIGVTVLIGLALYAHHRTHAPSSTQAALLSTTESSPLLEKNNTRAQSKLPAYTPQPTMQTVASMKFFEHEPAQKPLDASIQKQCGVR